MLVGAAEDRPIGAECGLLRGVERGQAKVLVGLDALLVELITRIAGSSHERVLDMVFRS
ncbi:hypothetical protein [Nocardia sp. NPDC049149]|uniref:hypothetical protein n=1 Tax=Nocardia sp. NPDC049149 TaxID=3364315 RepID=UPI003716695B